MRSDTSSVIPCASGALYAHRSIRSNRSPSRIGPGSYFRFHTSSIPPTPYFRFADPYPTSVPSLPERTIAKLSQFVAASGTRALMHSHWGSTGAMRGGHAAPALGDLASSAGTCCRPWRSLCATLPAPVMEGPVAGRPGIQAIWVRRVTGFFPGVFRSPCAGRVAYLIQHPAVHQGLGPCA